MQKIAMFTYHTCPLASDEGKETGGMNVYVLELSKELAKLGFLIDIFTRKDAQNSQEIVNVAKNLRVIHLPAGPKTSIPKKVLINHIDEFIDQWQKFTTKENLSYDIFDCHYYLSGVIASKIKEIQNSKIPLLITFHTLALMKNLVARGEQEQESQQRIDAEQTLSHHADLIIVPSKSGKLYQQYLYNINPSKIKTIAPGFNAQIFKPQPKNEAKKHINADIDHKIILFVGRIEPLKGIDVLLYALKILSQKNPQCTACLWIVGGDTSKNSDQWSPELQRLEIIKNTLDLHNMVKFINQKQQSELPYYYNSAEVVVMPSNYESFGMAALESMACGTPVILTNVSGISSFMDDSHKDLITSAHNPILLAENLEKILKNKQVHARLSALVHQKVQDLTWENVAQKIANVYKKYA